MASRRWKIAVWDIYILISDRRTCAVPNVGTKYDYDFETPNKSGQNFKSGQDMIDMYKELCAGTSLYIDSVMWALCYLIHSHFAIYWSCDVSFLLFDAFSSFLFPSLPIDYPIVSIEDPFDKEDWEHVKYFSSLGICQVCLDCPWWFHHVINISSDELLPIYIRL